MIFAWQTTQWEQLQRLKTNNRLPHALLLHGMEGTGKSHFANQFAHALLCADIQSNGLACGECHSCRLMIGQSHPNMFWVTPEKAGASIKIDQIREVTEFISQSSFQGGYRIVLIHPAENMNVNAANALLKTLEEPANDAILILVSHEMTRLPATIRSRCQQITFPVPDKSLALEWLEKNSNAEDPLLLLNMANGAPFKAMNFANSEMVELRQATIQTIYLLIKQQINPIQGAAQIDQTDMLLICDILLSVVIDLLHLQLNNESNVVNHDFAAEIEDIKNHTQLAGIMKLMQYLQQVRIQMCVGINLNKQLLCENMLLSFMECTNVSS